MNFLGSSSRKGFYDEEEQSSSKGKLPFSHSSCSSSPQSSSSPQHKGLFSLTNNPQQQEHPRFWMDNNGDERTLRFYNGGGGGGGVAAHHQLDSFMMDSSPRNNSGVEDDAIDIDDHVVRRPAVDSSDALVVGGEGGSNASVSTMVVEREHMFDKVVTPSDVGKLNRLVIPKQHAEKYFPLDSSSNEKGLLLNFEDRNGKPWRFRYSYWNSSQSYVMTKGWSRFVKEKKLDAGDIVSFQRGVGELGKDRLFIDWRRRPDAPDPLNPPLPNSLSIPHHYYLSNFPHRSVHPPAAAAWNPIFLQPQAISMPPRDREQYSQLQRPPNTNTSSIHYHHLQYPYSSSTGYGYGGYSNVMNPVIYVRPSGAGAAAAAAAPRQVGIGMGMMQVQQSSGVEPMVFESVPVVQGKAAAKRLRLFGVNMECPISDSDECDILSSTTLPDSPLPPLPHPPLHPPHLSSSAHLPSLQLRPYNTASPLPPMAPSGHFLNKGKSSMTSLDLDI